MFDRDDILDTLFFLVAIALMIFALIFFVKPAHAEKPDFICPEGNGWTKIDSSEPSHTTTTGVISMICVKGGLNQFSFDFDGADMNQCWQVEGIGSQNARAFKIGSGSECKDISHASFYVADVVPSPTPEPSIDPTPSPEPSIDPSPTPAVSPSPSPSIEPQSTPSPSPSTLPSPEVKSVEEQHAAIMQEIKEANGGVIPEIGFK